MAANCHIYDAHFAFRVKLRRHIKTERTAVYVVVIFNLELRRHIKTEPSDICDADFAFRVMLRRHIKTEWAPKAGLCHLFIIVQEKYKQ